MKNRGSSGRQQVRQTASVPFNTLCVKWVRMKDNRRSAYQCLFMGYVGVLVTLLVIILMKLCHI